MRVIFHVDIDAFFASVEEIEDPNLRGKPLIVGGDPKRRGVVSAANALARSFGVQAGMTTDRALRRCPKGVVYPPRPAVYKTYSTKMMAILQKASPIVESVSIDEAFIDITNYLPKALTPLQKARHLQADIEVETKLSTSIGIARNKLLAKIASASQKPHGVLYIPAGTEAEFLAPRPIQDLWGIGPKMAKQLATLGVKTIGQLAQLPQEDLVKKFGLNGAKLWRYAKGLDNRPVKANRLAQSISQETTFSEDIDNIETLEKTLLVMSHELARRLKKNNFTAHRIILKLRYGDFTTLTRSVTRTPATDDAGYIYRQALYLWQKHWNSARPLRMMGLTVTQLVEGVKQLSLFEDI